MSVRVAVRVMAILLATYLISLHEGFRTALLWCAVLVGLFLV